MRLRFYFKIYLTVIALVVWSVSTFAETSPSGESQGKIEVNFAVSATTKDKTHPHFGEGGPLGFVINGVQGRTLVLVRGKAYLFRVETSPMHDFYISTDPMGWGTAPLTAGVGGNFTYKGILTFKPSADTPDVVYYACRNHKFMGGEIRIVNPGEENSIKISEPKSANPAIQTNLPALDSNEVRQRLNFVNMYISNSSAAKRITASSNEEAKSKYKEAQGKLSEAMGAFDSDQLQMAKIKLEEAMGNMTDAAKLVPSDSMQKLAKSKNEELTKGVADMEAAYNQNREALIHEGSSKSQPKLESDRFHRMIEVAKTLSEDGKYEESNRILSNIMNDISVSLNKLLENKTMAYEMKFESPAQEYDYELERFTSLEKSIPQAVELKQPSQASLSLMESYVTKGKEKRNQANEEATRKNFAAAVENIKKGTEQLETALKLLGVN